MKSIIGVVVLATAFVCVSAHDLRRDPNHLAGVSETVGEGPEPYPKTPSHNLSNEISQSPYSRRRRLTPIYCDSVDNGICSTSSKITLASEGIFGPSSLLFNGALVESSIRSLVIQSTVECTALFCKMTFQDFDLLQISDTGSILGSDILLDVKILRILQGGEVNGTARGHPAGQGPGPGFIHSGDSFGASHGGKGGYWDLYWDYPYEVYGSETFPVDFGSGGTDSTGGGRISINATVKVEVDGTISEDGGGCIATSVCGSASGGSIYIAAEELLGTGRISADGGALALSTIDNAATGGGGRIAIYTNNESLGLTISTAGGTLNSNPFQAYTQGESGTIFRDKFQGNKNTSPAPYTAPNNEPLPTPTTDPTEELSDTDNDPVPSPAPYNDLSTDESGEEGTGLFEIIGNATDAVTDTVTDFYGNISVPIVNSASVGNDEATSSGALATFGVDRTACLVFVTIILSSV